MPSVPERVLFVNAIYSSGFALKWLLWHPIAASVTRPVTGIVHRQLTYVRNTRGQMVNLMISKDAIVGRFLTGRVLSA
jgi:hypothetical protein